jgi:hypothetical protein
MLTSSEKVKREETVQRSATDGCRALLHGFHNHVQPSNPARLDRLDLMVGLRVGQTIPNSQHFASCHVLAREQQFANQNPFVPAGHIDAGSIRAANSSGLSV